MKTCDNCAFDHMCNHWENGWEACDSWQPIIVYCRDCKHCGFCGKETNLEVMGFYGYCSRGERRDEGANNG